MRMVTALLLALSALPAIAAEPFARSAIEKTDTIVPGQQLRLTVDVFAPGFFTSPPDLPLFEMEDALVTLPEQRAQNLVETIDGVQYAGIRRQYAIVPERAGPFSIPPISINFAYSADGAPTTGTVTTAMTGFEVSDANTTPSLFSAKDVEISQSFDRSLAELREGDALVRTIIVTAKQTQAMLMPPVDTGAVTGLKQYTKPAQLADGVAAGRGETLSRRTETVVYTTQKKGEFTLPEIRYEWYDLDRPGKANATLPAVHIVVAEAKLRAAIAPEPVAEHRSLPEHRRQIALRILITLGLAGLVWMLRGLPKLILNRLEDIRKTILRSERYRLHVLRQTVLGSELPAVYSALHAWAVSDGFRTLRDRVADIPELSNEVQELERMLFSTHHGYFDRRIAANSLSARARPRKQMNNSPLPELNPSS